MTLTLIFDDKKINNLFLRGNNFRGLVSYYPDIIYFEYRSVNVFCNIYFVINLIKSHKFIADV